MSEIALKFLLANFAAACAIAFVIVLRRPVRSMFGARLAYALWLLVPLTALGSLLPPRIVEIVQPAPALPTTAPVPEIAIAAQPFETNLATEPSAPLGLTPDALSTPSIALDPWQIATLLWLAGAIVMFAWQMRNQSRFMADARAGFAGPAVAGFLRPRIVTPSDFEDRFDKEERQVILAHETIHLRRNDARINALVALVRCLCWFNPLIHVAAHLMRIDQELACDAVVVERHPKARATYASALLKAQLAARPLPLGCYWPAGADHPLTERVEMLKQAKPTLFRRRAGAAALVVLALGAGVTAWAAMPPSMRITPDAPQDQPVPQPQLQPLPKPQWGEDGPPGAAGSDMTIPPGYDGKDPLNINGTVEKIDFRDNAYVVFVRAINISTSGGWGARPNADLWELNPMPYWGDRETVTADLMGKRIVVRGFSALDKLCAPACRAFASAILMPKVTALPALASTPAFGFADFALHYDTNRPTFFQGKVQRLEFGERSFDVYVETEGWGGNPDWLYQVRSEYRHPRAEIERLLLNQTVSVAGWLSRLPPDSLYASPTGVYGTEFQLVDGRKIWPAGDRLLTEDKLAIQRRLELVETRPGEPGFGPAVSEPGKLPTIPLAFFADGHQAFDMNAPVTIDGTIVQADDDGWWVEIIGFDPVSTPGARAGAVWRVVSGEAFSPSQQHVGQRLTARGYNANDTTCQPHCRMNSVGGISRR